MSLDAFFPDKYPQTKHSNKEVLASRLAPWTPVQDTSPIAYNLFNEDSPCMLLFLIC